MGKEPVLFFCRRFVLSVVWITVACGGRRAVSNATVRLDDFGDTIHFGAPATRIVSLNPVTTEALFALGAGDRLIGRSKWDLYPDAARAVPALGDAMRPNVEAVIGARPDLVVLYAGEANRGAAAQLRRAGVRAFSIRTDHIADLRRVVTILAFAIGDSAAGVRVADSVEHSIDIVRARPRPAKAPTVFWHIWEPPLMTIGQGSYMSELVTIAGARNVFGDLAAPSPLVTLEEVVRRNPDYILTGPINAAIIRRSPLWHSVPAVRDGHLIVVDTILVGRPGVRLGEAARHLRAAILHDTIQ